jgi:hypothetical protein
MSANGTISSRAVSRLLVAGRHVRALSNACPPYPLIVDRMGYGWGLSFAAIVIVVAALLVAMIAREPPP